MLGWLGDVLNSGACGDAGVRQMILEVQLIYSRLASRFVIPMILLRPFLIRIHRGQCIDCVRCVLLSPVSQILRSTLFGFLLSGHFAPMPTRKPRILSAPP